MNSLFGGERVYFRSLATRASGSEVPDALPDIIAATKAAGFDLVIIETPGIGQGNTGIVDLVDVSLYVMTAEFGAASQLEKIDMLDYADVVAINKFERRGSADALRDVSRQLVRNREAFGKSWEDMPVFGTSAASFNDDGVTALYQHLRDELIDKGLPAVAGVLPRVDVKASTALWAPVPTVAGAVPLRDRRDGSRLSRRDRACGRCSAAGAAVRDCRDRGPCKRASWRRPRGRPCPADSAGSARCLARSCRVLFGRRAGCRGA